MDCTPWDLLVQQCAKHLSQKGETLADVRFFDEMNFNPSGGTMATIRKMIEGSASTYKSPSGFDPLLKNLQGNTNCNSATVGSTKSWINIRAYVYAGHLAEEKLKLQNQLMLSYSFKHNAWVGPFLMAWTNGACVHRSLVLNKYIAGANTGDSKKAPCLQYSEAAVYPNFFAAVSTMILHLVVLSCMMVSASYSSASVMCVNRSIATAVQIPVLRWLMYKLVFPKPGCGPSEKSMNQGFLKVTGYGTGTGGSKVKTVLYYPTDPGYRETVRMRMAFSISSARDGVHVT
jgi:hypothetical protein